MKKADYITFKEIITGKVKYASSPDELVKKMIRLKKMRIMLFLCLIAYIVLFAILIIGAYVL